MSAQRQDQAAGGGSSRSWAMTMTEEEAEAPRPIGCGRNSCERLPGSGRKFTFASAPDCRCDWRVVPEPDPWRWNLPRRVGPRAVGPRKPAAPSPSSLINRCAPC
jgi:hypothetical protein